VCFYVWSISSNEISEEEKKLLLQDAENKKEEIMYLNEIKIAQDNNDTDALEFYLEEYIKVPRLEIPEHLKEHPSFQEGGQNIKY
jgi:hypothetical protein